VLAHRLSPRSLRAELQSKRARLGASAAAMEHAAGARIALLRERLGTAAAKLDTLSPLGVLERGYAICHDAATGAVLTEAKTELAGRDVRIRLARGRLLCEVTRVEGPGE
jgi:exodeoxyribonuclease VII large subunit